VAQAGRPAPTRPTSAIAGNTFMTILLVSLHARLIAQPILQLPCQRRRRAEPYLERRKWRENGRPACKFVAPTV
jgi:hypothetical protein